MAARWLACITLLSLACAHDPNEPCVGNGCEPEEKPVPVEGVYASSYRQAVYNIATTGAGCAKACVPGGEFGHEGVWDESTSTCSWHADYVQYQSCSNWCVRETGLE